MCVRPHLVWVVFVGARVCPSPPPAQRRRQACQRVHIVAAPQALEEAWAGDDHIGPADVQRSKSFTNGDEPTPQPPNRRWQRHRRIAYVGCCDLEARCACCRDNCLLDLGKQTRQARRQEVRQQAECAARLWAIPASHANAARPRACVAAMTRQAAAAESMQWTPRYRRGLPLAARNVRLHAGTRMQRNLQACSSPRQRISERESELCGVNGATATVSGKPPQRSLSG